MRIFYYLSSYISHLTSGLDYISCLRSLGHEVICNLDQAAGGRNAPLLQEQDGIRTVDPPAEMPSAELVILHEEPMLLPGVYKRLPFLRDKRVVAFVPWENEAVSPAFIEPLGLVDEVWTPSEFSLAAFTPHFRKVRLLPHLVRRRKPESEDLDWARELKGPGFTFLNVADAVNPRKNIRGLLLAFNRLRREMGGKVSLILKQYRLDFDFGSIPGVRSLGETLSPGRIAALHAVSDAYVSPHRAEGWGLSLSESMAFGKPVIATGYSGNMQFMNRENSLLLPYRLVPIPSEALKVMVCFMPGMLWAEPDGEALYQNMKNAALGRTEPEMLRQASAVAGRFGPDAIEARLAELIQP